MLGGQVVIHARNHATTRLLRIALLLLLRVLCLLRIALLLLLRVLCLLRIALLLLLRVLRLLRITLLLLLRVLRLLRVLLLLGLLVIVATFVSPHTHFALQVLDANVTRRLAALLGVALLLRVLLLLLLVGVQLIAHAALALGHTFDNFF